MIISQMEENLEGLHLRLHGHLLRSDREILSCLVQAIALLWLALTKDLATKLYVSSPLAIILSNEVF
jgi:hypothetical protein